jgi:hypothetical protein
MHLILLLILLALFCPHALVRGLGCLFWVVVGAFLLGALLTH